MFARHAELQVFLQRHAVGHDEYCLVHDAVLALHGIRPNDSVAVCLAPEVYERLPASARLGAESRRSSPHLGGLVVVAEPYASLGVDDDSLLGSGRYTYTVRGLRCARLELELLNRFSELTDQTLEDIRTIERVATVVEMGWDWALVTHLARELQAHKASRAKPSLISRAATRLARGAREPSRALRAAQRLAVSIAPPGPELAPHLGWIPTRSLLALQYADGVFSRVDVAAYLLAAEEASERPQTAHRLFAAMSAGEHRGDRWHDFTALLESMATKGYNPRTPILVDSRGNIFDGVRRLALALHLGLSHVPIRIARFSTNQRSNPTALSRADLSESDRTAVTERLEELLCAEGVLFPVVLWPPALGFFDEIERILARFGRIVRTAEITLPWPQFEEFVRTVYGTDDYHQWQIEVKIHAMQNLASTYTFRVAWLELPSPEYRPSVVGGPPLPKATQRLKRKVRGAFAPRIEGYVGDVIIHMSDYPHENAVVTRAFYEAVAPEGRP